MEQDARELGPGTVVETDVCIVGAGPAGLTLACELLSSPWRVALLESGGHEYDPLVQRLSDGRVVGSPYQGLGRTRHRQVGGSAHLWNTFLEDTPGAKYVPLDPIDFEARSDMPLSGWPFDRAHLDPFYRRAHAVCDLGDFEYEARAWVGAGRTVLPGVDDLLSRVYRWGRADRFTRTLAGRLAASRRATILHHATCRALDAADGRNVAAVQVAGAVGRTFRVASRVFVLAAGAIENARLLLASRAGRSSPAHGWVGRCFMEHPRDYAIRLIPDRSEVFGRIALYDLHRPREAAWVIGRLALAESALRAHGLPNASVTLLPRPRRRPWLDAIGSCLGRLGAPVPRPRSTVAYGWSARRGAARRCDALQVLLNVEQRPDPDNRVVLASELDEHGVPKAVLHWRWRDEEQTELRRLRALVAARLPTMGLGRVEVDDELLPDPNAHHHAGTTRLSSDPRHGVVDANGRVHGTENLYVAGASVFPTAGFANPTLTIVALAIRLADHLRSVAGDHGTTT